MQAIFAPSTTKVINTASAATAVAAASAASAPSAPLADLKGAVEGDDAGIKRGCADDHVVGV